MWSSYFDDFLGLERHADLVVSFLFNAGLETVKRIPCASVGSQVRPQAHLGVSVVCNAPARLLSLSMNLTRSYWQAHSEPRDSEAAVRQWTIVWTQSQKPTETPSEHIKSGRKSVSDRTLEALRTMRDFLASNEPRRAFGRPDVRVYMCVDACFEKVGTQE